MTEVVLDPPSLWQLNPRGSYGTLLMKANRYVQPVDGGQLSLEMASGFSDAHSDAKLVREMDGGSLNPANGEF